MRFIISLLLPLRTERFVARRARVRIEKNQPAGRLPAEHSDRSQLAIGNNFAEGHVVEAALSNRIGVGRLDATTRPYADPVEAGSDAVVDLSADGRIVSWNAAAGRLFDLAALDAVGSPISKRKLGLAAVGVDQLLASATAFEGSPPADIDLSLSISPVVDRLGRLTGASLVAKDISDHMRDQRHQTLVIQELNHRMRNTFAIVQATARQVFKDWRNPGSPSALFLERVAALARNQSLLDRNCQRGLSIRDIAIEQIAPYAGGDMARCACEGPNIIVKPGAATALGMTFHELATNSAKYGAFSAAAGRVQLSWIAEGDGVDRRLRLCWREFGGPPVKAPGRRGLGSRMLEHGLAIELGGSAELRFHPAGLWYALTAPLASVESP